ncbi:inner-membrane translocator [Caballeronia hypogeia]|uniref:Inner-membrane translocator n=1 Tax=Caballeronia hypogeia TaxID=1777140 RepID=A0A158AEC7_9BURK|nr:branched-chain amino acid ABC transporter permease [Caballeronia hypogeia]SAK56085.1 inner-membrane translocator [Caballeronia hypogeia]
METVLMTGLAMGALYGAAALAYNVMFSTSKVLSVTTGHLFMLAAIAGAFFVGKLGLPVWLGFVGSVAVSIVAGMLTEVIAIRRVLARSTDHLWLLSTLALGTVMQQGVGLWWGTEPTPFPRVFEQSFQANALDQKFWLPILAVLLLALGLELFYRRTLFGKVFLAVAEDPLAATARAVNTSRVRMLSYGMAGLIGGVAGFAAGQLTFAYFATGLTLTLNGFIAIAVGGLGSNLGALIGGLALGLLSAFTTYFLGGQYQQTIAVGLLMAFLLIRPEGLFGAKLSRQV